MIRRYNGLFRLLCDGWPAEERLTRMGALMRTLPVAGVYLPTGGVWRCRLGTFDFLVTAAGDFHTIDDAGYWVARATITLRTENQ